MAFNFETDAFYESPKVRETSDNCRFPSFEISYDDTPFESRECRCPGMNVFSVLTKFSLGEADSAVTLMSLGTNSQFELSYDNCEQQFTLSFNEDCNQRWHTDSYVIKLDSPLVPGHWDRFAFEVTESEIRFFMNCELLQVVEVFRSNCTIDCTNYGDNTVVQQMKDSSCGSGNSNKVTSQ